MLEKMDSFFNDRTEIYDEHQLTHVGDAREFLRFTAENLPMEMTARVLDLGCGTGLELEEYFALNPTAYVTGIDLSSGMLEKLREKFADRSIKTVLGSYFDVPFGVDKYDAAVSVESLHHFTADEKTPLYRKLCQALKPGGWFILTDFFAGSDEEEVRRRNELYRLKEEQGIKDGAFYHFDTPLTAEHEIACLREAGFASVEVLKKWGPTCAIKAVR